MLTRVRFANQEGTDLVATIDGKEWSCIACGLVDGRITLTATGEIHNQVSDWLAAGNIPAAYVAPESDYISAVQAHIDGAAQARSYADGVSLASYKDSTNPSWAAEATTFISWRDSVWASAYATFANVQNGGTQPTIAELIAGLPSISWP